MTSSRRISCPTATTDTSESQRVNWNPYEVFGVPSKGGFLCKGLNGKFEDCGNPVVRVTHLDQLLETCRQQNPLALEEGLIKELANICLCRQNHRKDIQIELLADGFRSAANKTFRLDALNTENRATAAESLVSKQKRKLKRLLAEKDSLEKTIRSQSDELTVKEEQIEKLEQAEKHREEKRKKEKSAHALLICKLQTAASICRDVREFLRKAAQEKDNAIDALQQELEKLKLEHESQGSAYKESVRKLETEIATRDAEINKCNDDCAELKQSIERLQEQRDEKSHEQESALNLMGEELAETKKTNEMQTSIIEEMEEAKAKLTTELQSLSDKLSKCQSDLQATQASLVATTRVLEVQKGQLKEAATAKDSLTGSVRQLQEELMKAERDHRMMLRSIQEKELYLRAQCDSQEARVVEVVPEEPQSKRKLPERIKNHLRAMRHSSGSSKAEGDDAVPYPEEA